MVRNYCRWNSLNYFCREHKMRLRIHYAIFFVRVVRFFCDFISLYLYLLLNFGSFKDFLHPFWICDSSGAIVDTPDLYEISLQP